MAIGIYRALPGSIISRRRGADAEQRLSKLRQTKAKEIVRSISPFVIAAAIATVGIWTYQLVWPAPHPLPAVISVPTSDLEAKLNAAEVEQQRLSEEIERQAKEVGEGQTKLRAAQAELQNQADAAKVADDKRKVAEAEQQRLKDQVQRQTKAAADADTARKAAEAEQQRLATALRAGQQPLLLSPPGSKGLFEIRLNMEARADARDQLGQASVVSSIG